MSRKNLIVHETEGRRFSDTGREAIMMISAETTGSSNLSFAKVTVRPGGESQLHHHVKTEEVYYILSGSGKVVIDDEVFPVRSGHSILVPIGSRHQLVNTGDQDLVMFCADSPSYKHEDLVFESP